MVANTRWNKRTSQPAKSALGVKKMSQSYKQMEEDVARKVRETMDLAEARKKALTPDEDNRQTENSPRKSFEVSTEELERIDASIRTIEDIANKLTETHSAMGINVLNTGKAATAKRRFLTEDLRNLAGHKKKNLPANGNNPQDISILPLGFEHIRVNDQRQSGNNFQDAPYAANQLADKRQLAEGALSLAQSGAWNIANEGHADKRQLAEGALSLAQSAAWNIDNVYESDKRELPMGELNLALAEEALSLAQNAARNISNQTDDGEEREPTGSEQNPAHVKWNIDNKFQETDVNKRHLAEGALLLAQSGAWNIANEPYETNVVDKPQLAEGALNLAQSAAWNIDKMYESENSQNRESPRGELYPPQGPQKAATNVDNRSAEGELNLAIAEGALNLAKNPARNIDINADKRSLAEGALNMAQIAAWNIDKVYESNSQNAFGDFDEVNRRQLADGGLSLAQHSAKSIGSEPYKVGKTKHRQLSQKASSLDGSFVSTFAPRNQEKPQLGFDHVVAFKETIEQDKELKWVLDNINRKSLAEHDKKVISAAKAEVKKSSKDLQNIEIDINNKSYDSEQVDESNIRGLAEGALGLAQAGARSIDKDDISGVEIRELGEGALSLAQNAAKKKAPQNVGSCEDALFKNVTDYQKQTKLGFELIENTADRELEEAEEADNISFHGKTNK